MKNFFSKYSYGIVKMFVNQFAISLFGAGLVAALSSVNNRWLTIGISIFAIIFYLFLIYNMTWEIGAKDRISVDVGKKQYRPHTGLLMSLVANIPNFILAIVITVCYLNPTKPAFANVGFVSSMISLLLEGMYTGLLTDITIGGKQLLLHWWPYFVIITPALITSWVAYYLGHKNFRFIAGLFNKKSDAENKK